MAQSAQFIITLLEKITQRACPACGESVASYSYTDSTFFFLGITLSILSQNSSQGDYIKYQNSKEQRLIGLLKIIHSFKNVRLGLTTF